MAATCLPRETLKQYLVGDVEESQTEAIEAHLASCPACEQTVVELESTPDTLMVGIRALTENQEGSNFAPTRDEPSVVKQALEAARHLPDPSPKQASEWPVGQIGAYELLRPLGRGGMGMVVLARHKSLQKEVAIKLLSSLVGDKPELVNRFQREMRAAGRLQHPSIVNATDAGQERGTHYLVMEYVAGLDLSRIARLVGRLSIADACELMRQTALGLSHAHAEGIVHRDVKPSNLMLDATGHVKILDFGLAQINLWDEPVCELTTVGQLMGTIDYMAPEQAERIGAVDYRADLYAIGATLFRLIAGRAPLAASPNMTLLEKVRLLGSQISPLLSSVREDCPPELVELVSQLLSRDPAARPASAAHVAQALEPFCSGCQLVELLANAQASAVAEPVADPAVGPTMPSLAQPSALQFANNEGARKTPTRPPIGRWLWTAAAALPLLILAGIFITIETQKGQLVIQSDVADVQIKVARDGKVVDEFTVHPGAQSTRLRADKYEILIDAPSDQVVVDNKLFSIKSGETVVATIKQVERSQTPLPTSESKQTPSADELTYDGITYSQWLRKLATDVSDEKQLESLMALYSIGERQQIEGARPIVLQVLKGKNYQQISGTQLIGNAFGVLSKTFASEELYHQFIASEVRSGNEEWQSLILESHWIFGPAMPLIDVAKDLVSRTDIERPKTVEAAGDYLFRCVRTFALTEDEASMSPLLDVLERSPGLTMSFWWKKLDAESSDQAYTERIRGTFSRVASRALMNKVSADDGVRALLIINRYGDPTNMDWLAPYVSQLVDNPERISRFYKCGNHDVLSRTYIGKADGNNSNLTIPNGEAIDVLRLALQGELSSEKQAAIRRLLEATTNTLPEAKEWISMDKGQSIRTKFKYYQVKPEHAWNRLTETQRGQVIIATAASSLLPPSSSNITLKIDFPDSMSVGKRAIGAITITNNNAVSLPRLAVVITHDAELKAVAVSSANSPQIRQEDGKLFWSPEIAGGGAGRRLDIEFEAVAAVKEATIQVKASLGDKVIGEASRSTSIAASDGIARPAVIEPNEKSGEPFFNGRTLSQWFEILEHDRDVTARSSAMKAIAKLTDKTEISQVTERLVAIARQANNSKDWSDCTYVLDLVKFGGRGPSPQAKLDDSLIGLLFFLNDKEWIQKFMATDLLKGDDDWTARWMAALLMRQNKREDNEYASVIYERYKDKEAFDALGPNSAWLAQAWLVQYLSSNEKIATENVEHVIKLIEGQPHLGKLVVLQIDAEIHTRFAPTSSERANTLGPNGNPAQLLVEEAVAKYAKTILESDDSNPEAVARAASRLASTTEIVERWKVDLLEVIRKRLGALAKDHARLTTLIPLDQKLERKRFYKFSQRNPNGSPSKLSIPVANRFAIVPTSGFAVGRDGGASVSASNFRKIGAVPPYVESECVALIATIVRLEGASVCEKELTSIAELTWPDFDSLMAQSGSRSLRNPDQANQQTEPWSKISNETWIGWAIHRILFEHFVQAKEQLPQLSNTLNRTVWRLTFLEADSDGDGKLSYEETPGPMALVAEKGKDESLDFKEFFALAVRLEAEEKLGSKASGPAIEWAKKQIAKYDQNGDGKLTSNEWSSMIVQPIGADTDGDGQITVEEYAKSRER